MYYLSTRPVLLPPPFLSVCVILALMFIPHPCPQPCPPSLYPSPIHSLSLSTPSSLLSYLLRHPGVVELRPSLSGVDGLPYLIFMGEIIWKCVCRCRWGFYRREVDVCLCVCVCLRTLVGGGGCFGVYMKHHYHIKDELGSSVLMVITLPTIGTHCSDHDKKRKKNGGGMEG